MPTCIARQPILDRDRKVCAYELFFRDGVSNRFPDVDPDDATARVVLEGGLTLGMGYLTNGLPAFLNCSRESLIQGIARVLPPELTVVEVLESIEPDDEVIAACRRHREMGYQIALDDFAFSPRVAPLLAYADIVKLEMNVTTPEERRELIQRYSVKFVAEKVETEDEFQMAKEEGFHLFQGYHFGKPEMLDRPERHTGHVLSLLGAHLCRSEPDLFYLKRLIEAEPILERRLRSFVQDIDDAAGGSVAELVDLLTPEQTHRWGRVLLTEGVQHGGIDKAA